MSHAGRYSAILNLLVKVSPQVLRIGFLDNLGKGLQLLNADSVEVEPYWKTGLSSAPGQGCQDCLTHFADQAECVGVGFSLFLEFRDTDPASAAFSQVLYSPDLQVGQLMLGEGI